MSSNTTSPTPGPALLNERSLGGIAVHLGAMVPGGGVAIAGLAYLLATHEYTRANARNALNWHLTVLTVTVAAVATLFLGADEVTSGGEVIAVTPVPAPFNTVLLGVGTILIVVTAVGWTLSLLFPLIATGKAIFGTAWRYPGAYAFVGSDGPSASVPRRSGPVVGRWAGYVLGAYALLVPPVVGYGVWAIPRGEEAALPLVGGILTALVLGVAAFGGLVSDVRRRAAADGGWSPRWWLYATVPLVAGVLVFLARDATGSINPAGDGVYGALLALWLVDVVYLGQRIRYRGRS